MKATCGIAKSSGKSFAVNANVRVFANPVNSLLVQPGANAQLEIYCLNYELKLKFERRAGTTADACT